MRSAGDRGLPAKLLLLAGISVLCLLVSAWLGWRFFIASGGYPIWLLVIGNVSPVDIHVLKDLVLQPDRQQAAVLLFWMFVGPDLFLPACLAGIGILLLRHLSLGSHFLRRPVTRQNIKAILAVPVVYALADYIENAVSLAYFSIVAPPEWIADNAPVALPWIASFKMAFFFITALLILRFFLLRQMRPADDDSVTRNGPK